MNLLYRKLTRNTTVDPPVNPVDLRALGWSLCVAVASIFAFTGCNPAPIHPDRVDLTTLPVCVRAGFEPTWIDDRQVDASADCETGWAQVPGNSIGSRALRLRYLPLPKPDRAFLEYPDPAESARQYSLRFRFSHSGAVDDNEPTGEYILAFGAIGTNWEIYLNGVLLEREVHLDADGRIALPMYLRDHHIRFSNKLLRAGTNVLFLHIYGDPTFDMSGIGVGRPQTIGPARALDQSFRQQIDLALVALYLAAGLYHLLFFLQRPAERGSLYFGIFAVVLFVYFVCRSPVVYGFGRSLEILLRVEWTCLYWIIPLFHLFLDAILFGRVGRFARVNLVYHVLLSIGVWALPISVAWDALWFWRASMIGFLAFFLYRLVEGVWFERIRQSVAPKSAGAGTLAHTLLRTVPGNLLLGYVILGASAGYDVIDGAFLHRADDLARYGFFVFIMGIAGVLANRYTAAVHQVESLNSELRFRIVELNQANRELRDSEERYRTLVEESHDIIFTLDENFCFIRANRNLHRTLGVNQEYLAGVSFLELIYVDPDGEREAEVVNSRELLQAKLDEFAVNRKPIFQKVLFRSNFLAEPKELHLRLEYVDVHGRPEILGKASSVLEDNLLRYFIGERQWYSVGNSLITAEELSMRLVRNIGKYLDNQQLTGVRFGLREMLVNAIEHGNLNISYDDKTREILHGNYKEFIKSRQMDPAYRQRTVRVHYSLSPRRVVFLIRDEGAGFDHAAMRARKLEDLDAELSSHGRGIKMTESAFDRVRYNDRGNQVVLIKHFTDPPA